MKNVYYTQGFNAFSSGEKCAYSPTSPRGLAWAEGFADAECAAFSPEDDALPTLEDAMDASMSEDCS